MAASCHHAAIMPDTLTGNYCHVTIRRLPYGLGVQNLGEVLV